MDTEDRYTRITLRIPKELHSRLAQSADETSKSMNAEIIARLESTISTEEALTHMSSGVPLSEVGQMLIDLAQENAEAIENLNQMNLEVHARELRDQLSHTDLRLDKIESRIEYMIEQFQKAQKR